MSPAAGAVDAGARGVLDPFVRPVSSGARREREMDARQDGPAEEGLRSWVGKVDAARLLFALAVAVLAASLPSFLAVPFLGPQPLDFHNLWQFHDCFARGDPYAATGRACLDALGRDMAYPPPLYWAFAWTRLLTFEAAATAWMTVVALGTLAAVLAWIPARAWAAPGAGRIGLLAGLLLAQFPLAFALERGNNDVLVLVLWTAAALLWVRGRPAAAGFAAALAAALKLYPAFACAGLALGAVVAAARDRAWRPTLRLAVGASGALALAVLPLLGQWRTYLERQLPAFAAYRPGLTWYGHPLHTALPAADGWLLKAPLAAAWALAAARDLRRDPDLVLAGLLAASSYFAGTSWDYNLVTAFPLLAVQGLRATRGPDALRAAALLLAGVIGVAGARTLVARAPSAMAAVVWVQWGWLVASALLGPRADGPGKEAVA